MNVIRPFVLIDFTKTNRHGYRVDKASFSIAAFKKNPVLLYMHRRGEVHGRWEDITFSDHTITALPVFDAGDEKSLGLKGKVERGFLKAASLAFTSDCYMKDGVLHGAEVIETSLVDVPSYRETLMKNSQDKIYYNSINGLEINKLEMEDKKDQHQHQELPGKLSAPQMQDKKDQHQELLGKLSALDQENKELKTALVRQVLTAEGTEQDAVKVKAYASLDAKELLSLGVKKETTSDAPAQQQLDGVVLKGIERLAAAMGGKQEEKKKSYHAYSSKELAALEQQQPADFENVIKNYQAK